MGSQDSLGHILWKRLAVCYVGSGRVVRRVLSHDWETPDERQLRPRSALARQV